MFISHNGDTAFFLSGDLSPDGKCYLACYSYVTYKGWVKKIVSPKNYYLP